MKAIKKEREKKIYTKPVGALTGTAFAPWAGNGLPGIRLLILNLKFKFSVIFKSSSQNSSRTFPNIYCPKNSNLARAFRDKKVYS